jgi:signal transduction histidine kinase
MALDALLRAVSYIVVLVTAGITVSDALHHRDRRRREVAWMFGALGAAALVLLVTLWVESPELETLALVFVLAQPYFLLRLLACYCPVAPILHWISWIGIALAVGAGVLTLWRYAPPVWLSPLSVPAFVCFIVVQVYAVGELVHAARASMGLTRWRFALVTLGSACFAAIFLALVGMTLLSRRLQIPPVVLAILLTLGALGYCLAFVPPSQFRRTWQLEALRRFLDEMAQGRGTSASTGPHMGAGTLEENRQHVLEALCASATCVTGGVLSVIAMWDAVEKRLVVRAPEASASIAGPLALDEGDVITRAWRERQPLFAQTEQSEHAGPDSEDARLAAAVGTNAFYAVPLANFGLLLVFLPPSFFPVQDLALIALLAAQSVVALNYGVMFANQRALVERLRHNTEQLQEARDTLELRVQDRTAELEDANRALQQYSRTLAQLNQLGQKLTATLNLQQIAEQLSLVGTDIVSAEGMSVWLLDMDPPRELVCWASYNRLQPDVEQTLVNVRLQPGQGIAGWVVQQGESVFSADARRDPRFFAGVDEHSGFETHSLLAVPLRVRGAIIGVLELLNKQEGQFVEEDVALIETLAASVAVAIDNARLVDELRQRAADLEAQNAELDAFAHTVAHDLKTPLTSLIGYGSFLINHFTQMTTQMARDQLRTIVYTGHRMTNIINELLLLASVRKMEDVEMRALDMAAIVAEAQDRLERMIAEAEAEISVPKTWPTALGYGPWVEEVWVNYISNAVKYGGCPEDDRPPSIELGFDVLDGAAPDQTTDGETRVRFWVRDNGPGLAPEEQARLFAQFTRLHQVRAEGHGLGLSIVQRIIEKLGGEVGVESQVGEGSTFFFTLPGAGS